MTRREQGPLRTTQGPLRKVVAQVSMMVHSSHEAHSLPAELYECGHVARPKQDIIGETNAYRRRCYRCRDQKPLPRKIGYAIYEYDEDTNRGE